MCSKASIGQRVLQICCAIPLAILLLPVVAVYAQAFLSPDPSGESIFDPQRQATLLMRTLIVGAGAAGLALVFGLAVGFAAQGMRRPTRALVACGCAVSILTPPYVFAVAWIDLWGPAGWLFRWSPMTAPTPGAVVYSVPGAAVALAAAYYPIVAFAAYTAFRRVDPRGREAAALAGRSRGYFAHIALPIVARPIGAAALAVLLLALYEFPVHSLLQVDTYLVEIHAAAEYHDYRAATLLSVPLVAVAALCIIAAGLLLRGQQHADAGIASRDTDRGVIAKTLGWVVVLFAGVLPLAVVISRALPPSNFVHLFQTAWPELFWSTLLALIACTMITLLGVASTLAFNRPRVRACVDVVSAVPYLVSGPLLGLGLIAVYNRPGLPGLLYDSSAILLLAWTARYLFIAQWGIGAAVRGQSRSIHEAARVCGVPWWRVRASLTIPLAMPYIVLVCGIGFILTFREVDTAVLVAPPGTELASVRLFTLMHYGPDGYVMAMALTMCGIAFIAGAIFFQAAASWKRVTDAGAE